MSKGSKNKTIQENSTIQEYPDGRNYDATAVRNIAQEWIDKHMKNREQEFTKGAECSVFCGTWNVNAKKQEGGLQDWLLPNNQQTNIDVYAIGFQEIVDLNAVNVALNSNNTQQRAQFWEDKINECLEVTGTKYRLIGEKYLVGLLLCIYVKESLLPMIRDVRMTSLGVGIMGMMGNKGGVSIRFSIYDSTIVFICSHLAAHRENVIGRNNDFKNIYEKSLFYVNENNLRSDEGNNNTTNTNSNTNNNNNTSSSNGPAFSPTAIIDSIIMPRQGAARYYENNLTISDHDIIFWMGDLNYRIDDSIIIEDIFRAIEKNDLEILRQKDQLNIERLKNRVFQGFQEGVLTFAPTYKYQPGTDVYETRAEKKLRAPAWCDRILWKIMNKDLIIKLIDYRRSNLLPSDHKPVSGNYHVTLKEVVENKEKIIFNELMSFLKKYPSKELPILDIKGLKINFDKVLYEIKKESIIEMKNIGESMAFWHFVPKMEESVVCKKWITLDKESGLLLPGESVTITATIFVDSKTAHVLNAGKDLLQDVLILRIENSNDYYVDIKADYERSCFGMSLEDLIQFPQPISDLPLPAANPEFFYNLQLQQQQQQLQSQSQQGAFSENMTSGNNNAANVKLSIPKELWRIIDALWAGNALREKDLFNTPGDTSEISQIRYALDHGLEFNFPMSPHSLADCLIHFLNSLPKPLLPMELYPTAEIDPMNMRSFCRKFLEDLPTINYNVFVYLISFFREVLAEESYNRCTAEQLSSVCVQCMTSTNGTTPSTNDDYFIDFSDNLTKEEKEKRLFRQSYVQQIIFHLLTTNTI